MRSVDWILLACCGLLLLAGPAMALQELAQAEDDAARASVTGRADESPSYDAPFRGWWRGVLLLVVLVAGAAGFVVTIRIARQPRVRDVSGRLVALLLLGLTLLDLAFLADGRWFLDARYQVRAATIVWLYPAAGILMAGATLRLIEVERLVGEEHAQPAKSAQ